MESVYLETTFISYLVARPSRDVIVAGHQQTTQEWWANRRSEFECSVSQVVIDEASASDPAEVQKRLAIIGNLPWRVAAATSVPLLERARTRRPTTVVASNR